MKLPSLILDKLLPQQIAYAHCDIPCGIYDPHNAQLAAHTVIRMTQLLQEIKREDEIKAEHDIARITHVKEEHSSLIEEELETLKNDYFKIEHFKKFSNLKDLFEKAFKSSVIARQSIDIKAAEETLELTMQVAELFYKSKGINWHRVKAPYPTGLDIVVQK